MKIKIAKRTSLSQIYKGMILIMIPVLMIGAVAAISLGRSIQKQAFQVLRGNIDSQVEQLLENMNNINYSLMTALNSNGNLQMMVDATNKIKKYYAITELKSDFSDFRYYFGSDYNFFTYDLQGGNIYALTPDNLEYNQYTDIKQALVSYMSFESRKEFAVANRRWNLVESEQGMTILIKVYQIQGKTLGCWVLLDTIEQMFSVNQYSDNNSYMFLIKDGQILADADLFETISLGESVNDYISKSGKKLKNYDVYHYDFNKGSFTILSIVDTMGNYNENIKVLYVFVLLFCIVIGVGIFLLHYIRVRLIRPIYAFMDRLQDPDEILVGDKEFRLAEFRQADELFWKAKKQIKDLKIAIYEKEIEKQRLEEEYSKVQIRPHFYLNCLNIIYNMAQSKRYEEIQLLSMEVSNYMRTLFRSGMDLVLVKEEIQHLQGYLNIQEFRYSSSFTYGIQVDEEVMNYRILPLIIHTIVENSIKHTIMKRAVVHIDISVMKEFERAVEYIKIQVWDTGDGFSQDVLLALQSGQKLVTKEGNRIGLCNMIQRLEYIYKGQACVQFSNGENGGAMVQILLPIRPEQEEIE